MTHASALRDASIAATGSLVGLIGTALFALFTGAWSGKETVADHKADINSISAELTRIRDVVCLDHRYAPQCQPMPQPPPGGAP